MKYDVILADPPWHFKVWSEITGSGRSASRHYPVMSIEEICALPVGEITAADCALFLWVTYSTMYKYPPLVFDAWGFTYRTEAWPWLKRKDDKVQMGNGYYTRNCSELCLLAVKGSMPVADHGVKAYIEAPRRKHSQKPDEQYEKIERLYPNMRYIELFARHRRPGWHAWGNEVDSDIDLGGLNA